MRGPSETVAVGAVVVAAVAVVAVDLTEHLSQK